MPQPHFIPYRFFDYQQASGLTIRTVHIEYDALAWSTETNVVAPAAEREKRRHQIAQRLAEEQRAVRPEVDRRRIDVLGVQCAYPDGWDATGDASAIVDAPSLVWGKGTIMV